MRCRPQKHILAGKRTLITLVSENNSETENEETREMTFHVEKIKPEEETVTIDDYASLTLKTCSTNQQKLYGSSSGLLLIKTRPKQKQLCEARKKKLCQVSDFNKNSFRLSQIDAQAKICNTFKQEYIIEFHEEIKSQVEKNCKESDLQLKEKRNLMAFVQT